MESDKKHTVISITSYQFFIKLKVGLYSYAPTYVSKHLIERGYIDQLNQI